MENLASANTAPEGTITVSSADANTTKNAYANANMPNTVLLPENGMEIAIIFHSWWLEVHQYSNDKEELHSCVMIQHLFLAFDLVGYFSSFSPPSAFFASRRRH